MKKYTVLFFAALLAVAASCTKKEFDPEADITEQESSSKDKIYLWVNAPEETKVQYTDGLGISGHEGGFTMQWEVGDSLYAIRWDDTARGGKGQALEQYIVLETTKTTTGGQMFFQGTTRGQWNLSDLKGGEHFVLVHGHFVLDPDTDGGVLDFPTSEVTKAGYASHIHHGGVEGTDGSLTFRNQDGTLANLKKHEYMVADAYVRFQDVTRTDENGEIVRDENGDPIVDHVPFLAASAPSNDDNPEAEPSSYAVRLLSAHTLIRLTMFVPDGMFSDIDYRLLAVSLRTESNDQIFHRYFRLHPNTAGQYGPSGWKVDWNDGADKESNIYFRANLPGTRQYDEINDPASPTFDQNKTVCIAGTDNNGVQGHYVTLYFSLPSRPLAKDNTPHTPCKLFVTAFTRTHAYRTIKSYTIGDLDGTTKMRPGAVVNLNVNFDDNNIVTKAITDPNLGVTFAPGLVYAVKNNATDANWTYGIYDNQGEYAGLDQQTDVMGDYFIFGSIDPRQVFHQHYVNGNWIPCTEWWDSSWKINAPLTVNVDNNGRALTSGTTDVAALAVVAEYNNVFTTMSKKEADRVWARIQLEAKQGLNRGYYYYDASAHDTDDLRHTAHQAKGAHTGLSKDDPRRKMSSTIGIWIGTKDQPSLADQDKYVFLPSSNQLNNSTNNMVGYEAELRDYEDVEHYKYWASTDFGNQHVTSKNQAEYEKLSESDKALYVDIPTKRGERDEAYVHHYYKISELTGSFSAVMKFSTNTRDIGTSGSYCERFQVWLNTNKTFHSNCGIKPMDQTFGRVVRPVIY